jgi:hypothetical protein
VTFLSNERQTAERWLRGDLTPADNRRPSAAADELLIDETGIAAPAADRPVQPAGSRQLDRS